MIGPDARKFRIIKNAEFRIKNHFLLYLAKGQLFALSLYKIAHQFTTFTSNFSVQSVNCVPLRTHSGIYRGCNI